MTLIAGAFLSIGLLAFASWQLTGNDRLLVDFFQGPAAWLTVVLAGMEFWFCLHVVDYFAPGDLLRPGWILISGAAAGQFVGYIFSQILGVKSRWNPVQAIPLAHDIGLFFGGTFSLVLLAGGLWFALRAYRQSRLLGQLGILHYLVLAVFAGYLLVDISSVVAALRAGKHPGLWEVLSWPVDPLLWLLLVEALLLYRSAQGMGGGRVGLCWKAFAVGVCFTALGDIGIWATNFGYLVWPWSSLVWYVWLPASAAYLQAPAFQLDAIREAMSDRD